MEIKALPEAGIDAATEKRLKDYAALLLEMNCRVRLVGPRDFGTLWDAHICDCLKLLPLLPESGSVADVGTGGGLPGAVLAICRPDLGFTLMDSVSRKTNALSEMVARLGIANAQVECVRSEDYAAKKRETFDCATVRAVSEAGVIAEYLSPLVKKGGSLLAMKGSSVAGEIEGISGKWKRLGLSEPRLFAYEICGHGSYMLTWEKISRCPPQYPRQAGKAAKKPWWE